MGFFSFFRLTDQEKAIIETHSERLPNARWSGINYLGTRPSNPIRQWTGTTV